MVIDLTVSEKRTFIRFLTLYLGSSLILMLLIAFFYFENEKRLYFDLAKSNMQNAVSKISSKIIFSHMTDTPFDKTKILDTNKYKISFYNEKKEKIFGNLNDEIDFSKDIMQHDKKHFILIDRSTLGHLGIYYIAIEEKLYFEEVKELKVNIILFFLIIYSLISLTGFYLAKLFLLPIKEEREKLNNFIRDTTHELNTPISAILMSTEKKQLSEKQIERVRLSARRVSEIYKDLTYIFLQKNGEKRICEKLSIDMLILEQLEYFEPLASKKRIKITSTLEAFEYVINKDDAIRVINNLISNAIKYNKVGGKIDISLKNRILKISDTGIGIEEEKLKDIYKRYYRATTEQGGFGIGLNIVSKVCNKYKIEIQIKSKLKEGTIFTLNF
ncbi:HAMP domain-containing histidine kinase [Poseidonibacter lekithochrous]|uniref:sensor histidine kinase n=1 Tax=Poseidonibacter TaxID=2321187 RepID=UPI001C09006F|nr:MULTISPECIES: HAMP domain-containing sensor histidine kinase [Poseidonibacter]MBU3015630.1 HAMP domain-containing histidine kinase [Poseidonibacter lekithochrous]MDO6828930.1 HAMP domain-containing sensor histidine kinase [Poseidonibacter sp. 1_MG-2023]